MKKAKWDIVGMDYETGKVTEEIWRKKDEGAGYPPETRERICPEIIVAYQDGIREGKRIVRVALGIEK